MHDDGASERFVYGEDPSHYADRYRPAGASRGVVVVIHGGFWKAAYDASLGQPLARCLADHGWNAWNIEYRRVGNGGGVPQTLDDVAAAIDALAGVPGLSLSRVVTLGHSAGGHLAAWAAARDRFSRWASLAVPVTQVISQAGVLDLVAADRAGLGNGAVRGFIGESPSEIRSEVLDEVDPTRHLPLSVPIWCIHGENDDTVPVDQSASYVSRAQAAGASAELVTVAGDHFDVIDPANVAWQRVLEILDAISGN
jgi:acetyl esterase/lipase